MEIIVGILRLTAEVAEVFGPWVAVFAAGAYCEARYGATGKALAANLKAKLDAETAALKAKL